MQIISPAREINGGVASLLGTPVMSLIGAALANANTSTQKAFTKGITGLLRDSAQGWSQSETQYTHIQPPGQGRPRAIDFFHAPSRTGVELELGNQTCFTHDLLKLEVAFRSNRIARGVILTVSDGTARHCCWTRANNNSYLCYETACVFLDIFGNALSVPLCLVGFSL